MSKKIKEFSLKAKHVISDPRHKKKWQGFVGLLIIISFVAFSVAINQIQAQKNAGYGYGYLNGSYGYGYTYSDYLPNPATSLSCSAASITSISCSWTAPTTTKGSTTLDNLTGYRYTYSTSSNSTCNTGGSTTTSTSVTISDLDPGTTYYVAVCAYDDNANYSAAATASATTTSGTSGGGGGLGRQAATTTTTTSTGYASATITVADGGIVTTSRGYTQASVEIPANALSADSEVSVEVLSTADAASPSSESGLFLIGGLVFQFNVDGGSATFNQPVTLTFSYSDLQVEGLIEENLIVYQWNVDSGAWEALDSIVDTVNNIITAQTDHFSVFAIMAGTGEEIVGETNIPIRAATVDQEAEDQAINDFTEITGAAPNGENDNQIVYFMAYGASTESKAMSQHDRKGVITDFVDTYGRVPSAAADWNDIAKILSGHKPSQRNLSAEQQALIDFGRVYKRMPDYTNVYDEWALYYMAYNIRPIERNLDNERFSIGVFKNVYGENPSSASDWAIVRAISYTGAKR